MLPLTLRSTARIPSSHPSSSFLSSAFFSSLLFDLFLKKFFTPIFYSIRHAVFFFFISRWDNHSPLYISLTHSFESAEYQVFSLISCTEKGEKIHKYIFCEKLFWHEMMWWKANVRIAPWLMWEKSQLFPPLFFFKSRCLSSEFRPFPSFNG